MEGCSAHGLEQAGAPDTPKKAITHPGPTSALPSAHLEQGQPSIPLIRPFISSFIQLSQASLSTLSRVMRD